MNMLVPEPAMLLTRIASTLEQDVLPQMRPSYACTEVQAAVTMLRNLAGRVEWRSDDLSDDLVAVSQALEVIVGEASDEHAVPPAPRTFEALHASREQLGVEIDGLYSRSGEAPVAALAAVLGRMVDTEDERNRRGA